MGGSERKVKTAFGYRLEHYLDKSGIQLGKLDTVLLLEGKINPILFIADGNYTENIGKGVVMLNYKDSTYLAFEKYGYYIATKKNEFHKLIIYMQIGNNLKVMFLAFNGDILPIVLNSRGRLKFDIVQFIVYKLYEFMTITKGIIDNSLKEPASLVLLVCIILSVISLIIVAGAGITEIIEYIAGS